MPRPSSHTSPYDVAVIGGGHNGLVSAAYLAAAGFSVVVLEKNAVVGGAALTEEFHPGFRNSVASYTVSLLNPKVIRELELARHGLRIIERPMGNFWPIDAKRSLVMPYADKAVRYRSVAQFSKRDADRLSGYDAALGRAANVLRDLVLLTPPNAGGGLWELIRGAGIGRRMLGLPVNDQRLVADLFTQSASDFLSQWFESDVVRGAFAYDGIVGSYASPATPGTAYVLLHHCFGEVNGKPGVWGHAVGGMGAIAMAMEKSAASRGADIRTKACVRRLLVEEGRATGVELDTGEIVRARAIASNVPPKLLFRDLIDEGVVCQELRERFLSIQSGSGSFRMNVALSELPDFTCCPGMPLPHHSSGIMIAPALSYLERAYHDSVLEGWSRQPVIEMLIPSVLDDTLAPRSKHVASLFVQHVAPHLPLPRSWSDANEKEAFADLVIDTVTRHAPNFKGSVLGRQVLSPLDLEHRFGLIDGDIFHGQLSLNQLFTLRPVLGFADYRMPVKGLYLCGSGAHPGGGVTGVPGHNAAREIIKDLKKRRRS